MKSVLYPHNGIRESSGWCSGCWRRLGNHELGACLRCSWYSYLSLWLGALIRDFVGKRYDRVDQIRITQDRLMDFCGWINRDVNDAWNDPAGRSLARVVLGPLHTDRFRDAVGTTWHATRWIRFDLVDEYAPIFLETQSHLENEIAAWRESGRAECREESARDAKWGEACTASAIKAIGQFEAELTKPSKAQQRAECLMWMVNGRNTLTY